MSDSGKMPVDPFVAAAKRIRSDADGLIDSLKLERIATLGDVRRVLAKHYLAGVNTDSTAGPGALRPLCGCMYGRFPVYHTLGEAIDGWIVHVMGILEAPEIT